MKTAGLALEWGVSDEDRIIRIILKGGSSLYIFTFGTMRTWTSKGRSKLSELAMNSSEIP